jgi:hemerythrin
MEGIQAMAALEWSAGLALDLPLMDNTHQEFVALLQSVELADDVRLLSAWQELVEHTQAHFDQEDRWMQATRFASGNCHSLQH